MNNKLLATKILIALLDKKAILNGSTDKSINIIESVLSESGGSVGYEARRPEIEELIKIKQDQLARLLRPGLVYFEEVKGWVANEAVTDWLADTIRKLSAR